MSKSNNYVNNKDFLHALIDYKQQVHQAQENDEEPPPVPHYIAQCILKIAEHMTYHRYFINYPFRDDLIGDGVELCIRYIDNFDENKSSNPFAYFTQIVYTAFRQRCERERTHLYTKFKLCEKVNIMDETTAQQEQDDDEVFDDAIKHSQYSEEYMNDYIQDFEAKKFKGKKK